MIIEYLEVIFEESKAEWLLTILPKLSIANKEVMTYTDIKADYETQHEDFEILWFSKEMIRLKMFGLLTL